MYPFGKDAFGIGQVMWIKVPSHFTVDGNNEANKVGTLGLQSHPLYPF